MSRSGKGPAGTTPGSPGGAGGASPTVTPGPDTGLPSGGMGRRLMVLLAVVSLTLAAAGVYAVWSFQEAASGQEAASAVQVRSADALPGEPFVMFRNTAPGQGYGQAATVPLALPAGERALSGRACYRVYATRTLVSCLAISNGVPTTFEAAAYGSGFEPVTSWVLGGVPSRTRISPDGSLVATTVFVSGHSYDSSGLSTETVIHGVDGTDHGNLEEFALMSGGTRITAPDRNFWGVTFVPGHPEDFYATAASGDNIWLVRGSLNDRTLTVVASGVECPSISPDGTRIAFKKSVTGTLLGHRNAAVLELSTGKVTILAEERNLDDQIEWLDNSTLVYGIPRDDSGRDSDIWSLSTDPGEAPRLLIEHAWSPAVVR